MNNTENTILNQASQNLFQYNNWRTRFLNLILRLSVLLGLPLIFVNYSLITNLELIAFFSIYMILVGITFAPVPYSIKGGTLVAAGYFIGTYTLTQFGPWSDGTIYLLGSALFASLLFDEQVDRWVFGLCLATIAVLAGLNLTGSFELAGNNAPGTGPADWLTYSADFVFFGITFIWALNLLKTEFRSVAEQYQTALNFVSKDRSELEKAVEQRNAGLLKKTDQLRAASFITRQTADLQELENILESVVRLVTDQFGYYHAGIFLMNESGEDVILQAASSEGGMKMIERGHSLKVGTQGIVGYAAAQKKPRIALDVGADAVYFDNPDLPKTRSEVALPLMIRNKVLGILDIQSTEPSAFGLDDIDVLQTLADQVAVAIENSRLLADTQAALSQIEALTNVRTREAWNRLIQSNQYAFTYTPLGLHSGNQIEKDNPDAMRVPITLRGQKIGQILLTRKDKKEWSSIEKDLVLEVANQTGLAVENLRLVEEATERARQEQTVGELALRFSQSSDIDSLLQTAARELGQVTDVTEASVYIGQLPTQAGQRRRAKRTTG